MKVSFACNSRLLLLFIAIIFIAVCLLVLILSYVFGRSVDSNWTHIEFVTSILSAAFLSCFCTFIINEFVKKIKDILQRCNRAAKLWNLNTPDDCLIALASRERKSLFSRDIRYTVGQGQVMALPHIITSLYDAYGEQMSWNKFMYAHERSAATMMGSGRGDVILLGGTYTNPLTCAAFDLLRDVIDVGKINDRIQVRIPAVGSTDPFPIEGNFSSTSDAPRVDKAIIINCETCSHLNVPRRIIVMAGCSTYGTEIAARYYCHQLQKEPAWRNLKGKQRNFALVISCHFSLHPPVFTKVVLEKFYVL